MPEPSIQRIPDAMSRPPPLAARLVGSELLEGFALNSAELTEGHKGRLRILANTLKSLLREYPGGGVQITGHTDASGDEKFNEWLGQKRADAVRDYLVEAGVPVAAMVSLSAGESDLRIQTGKPEPRNRLAWVRFEPESMTRLFPPLKLAQPSPRPENKGVPAPGRLCADYPELCLPDTPDPSRALELTPPCKSTDCSAVSVRSFDRQPAEFQRVIAASFDEPARWFERELDHDRRLALTSVYNRLCRLGLWCGVRQVRGVQAGEAPVSVLGAKFKVPGLSVSVDFVTDDNQAFLDALIRNGANCIDTGLGGALHSGQTSVRGKSTSDSLHVAVGSANLSDAHEDLYASVPPGGEGLACRYDVPGTLAHLGRELAPEKFRSLVRWLTEWMKYVGPMWMVRDILRTGTAGVQVFPDFTLTPTVPQPEPANRQDAGPLPLVGITWSGPISDERRPPRRNTPPLPEAIEKRLDERIPSRIRRNALIPPEAKGNLAAAELARENAGPDEERALIAALESVRERIEGFADAHEFAKDMARWMYQARRSGLPAFSIQLGQPYAKLSPKDTKSILAAIRDIAKDVRILLAERVKDVYVNKVWVLFGDEVMWEVDF